jgi:hypothetical protein
MLPFFLLTKFFSGVTAVELGESNSLMYGATVGFKVSGINDVAFRYNFEIISVAEKPNNLSFVNTISHFQTEYFVARKSTA